MENTPILEKKSLKAREKAGDLGRMAAKSERRKRAVEAYQLPGQQSPEHIGHVLITAAETAPVAAKNVPRLTEKRVETLNRAELLDISEKLIVDGSTLRQIYETHLISEKGLRRLVGEHLSGGDLKKALRQEIVEHEIDFERDPLLRDMTPQPAASNSKLPADNATLDTLLQKASLGADTSQEVTFSKAQAQHEALQQQQQLKQQRLADISLFTVICLLVALVIFFFITRG